MTLPEAIHARIEAGAEGKVWSPFDFTDIGSRDAVDKALQRLTKDGRVRRVARGLYDRPRINKLIGKVTVPDYRSVIEAVVRRNKARCIVDGAAAANLTGLSNGVPAKVRVLTDARLKTVELGNQRIVFRHAAPSRLYWAGRPGMYIVQALHWLRDNLDSEAERSRITRVIRWHMTNEEYGDELIKDLRDGLPAMPVWMQDFLRETIASAGKEQAA